MKKIIGNSKISRDEEKYYDMILSDHATETKSKDCVRKEISSSNSSFYPLLPHCPHINTCQTLDQWKFQMLTSKINRMFASRSLRTPELILYFVPIGPFPEFIHQFKDHSSERNFFQLMVDFIKSFFPGSIVRQLPEININEISVTSRYHELTGKQQYHVSNLLIYLQKNLPPDGFSIIGLSWHDMYPCEKLNFILGQGSAHHSACVSSFGRFDPNYVKGFKGQEEGILPENMKDITEINGDVLWKLFKVLSHETCHVFGISHCTVFKCLMNASTSTGEALSQPMYLCPLCMSKIIHLQTLLRTTAEPGQATVKGHFSSLLQFLQSTFNSEEDVVSNQHFFNAINWFKNMNRHL